PPLPTISTLSLHDALPIFNRGTGQQSQSTTNDSGLYTFQNVSAGVYDLTVTASGFGSYTTEGIELNVNTVQRHDVVLKVGQVAEDRKSTRLNSSHVAISYA